MLKDKLMMQQNKIYKYLPFLILLLGFISVRQIPLSNTFTNWILYLLIVIAFVKAKKINGISFKSPDYKVVSWFLAWAVIGIVIGGFKAENYWEYKTLVGTSFILLFPLVVYAFNSPYMIQQIYRIWIQYSLPVYVLLIFWMFSISQFYLGPVYFIACYFPLIPQKKKVWRIIIFILIIALLTYHYQDCRSQFIKAAVSIMIALGCYYKRFISNMMIKTAHWLCYIVPVVLLVLGISGVFNIFSDTSDKYQGRNVYKGADSDADISSDTRTFIYYEVITSALRNNYVVWGRSPARGNDTNAFYDLADNLRSVKAESNIKRERSANELCFPNIFTWLGLIGMFLYIAIYLRASYMGVYHSNNFYVKMAGLVTAFNFAYGWVENVPNFDILNIVYWTFISICLSSNFRSMSNSDFESWFRNIFY